MYSSRSANIKKWCGGWGWMAILCLVRVLFIPDQKDPWNSITLVKTVRLTRNTTHPKFKIFPLLGFQLILEWFFAVSQTLFFRGTFFRRLSNLNNFISPSFSKRRIPSLHRLSNSEWSKTISVVPETAKLIGARNDSNVKSDYGSSLKK